MWAPSQEGAFSSLKYLNSDVPMPDKFFKTKESESCDYKLQYHVNKAKLLHDILCLSNADSQNLRQLTFGVSNDLRSFPGIAGDQNRIDQAKLISWLRTVNLNHIPEIEITTQVISCIEFDIITIQNRPEKPYFLTQHYRNGKTTLQQGAVYTRDKDVNTAIDRCATDKQIEKMYKERFGLDSFLNCVKVVAYELPFNFRNRGNIQNPFITRGLEKLVHDEPMIHNDPEFFEKASHCLNTARTLSTAAPYHPTLKPGDGQYLMKDLAEYIFNKFGIKGSTNSNHLETP